jgi:RNA polymerase sigma factor (sigma-70 family)
MAMDPTADVRFTRMYEAHYADVLAYCARRVSRIDAEEVASEVFAVLWRRLDNVEDELSVPWLYGVAYRMIANKWRTLKRQYKLHERLHALGSRPHDSVETVVIRRDEDHCVLNAIAKLKPTDQEVHRLSAWEELTAPQIAEVVGCSTSAAEQRLHRAKKRLAKTLSPSNEPSVAIHPLPAEEGGRP